MTDMNIINFEAPGKNQPEKVALSMDQLEMVSGGVDKNNSSLYDLIEIISDWFD